MSVTTANILIGMGTLRMAGIDLGATDGGFRIRHNSEWYDVMVDQSVGIQKKKLIKRRVSGQANIAEASLANMYLAWGQPSANLSGQTLTFDGSTLGEITAVFIGVNPSGYARLYNFNRVISLGNTDSSYEKDKVTYVPIEFEVLPSVDGGDIFYTIRDATI